MTVKYTNYNSNSFDVLRLKHIICNHYIILDIETIYLKSIHSFNNLKICLFSDFVCTAPELKDQWLCFDIKVNTITINQTFSKAWFENIKITFTFKKHSDTYSKYKILYIQNIEKCEPNNDELCKRNNEQFKVRYSPGLHGLFTYLFTLRLMLVCSVDWMLRLSYVLSLLYRIYNIRAYNVYNESNSLKYECMFISSNFCLRVCQ